MKSKTITTVDVDYMNSKFEVGTVKSKKEFGPCLPVLADGKPFKRYAVLAWNVSLHPQWGWGCLRGRFYSLDDARTCVNTRWAHLCDVGWWQIVDLLEGVVIDQRGLT